LLSEGRFIVVDIGKTQAKVSLWSGDGRLLDRQTRRNAQCEHNGQRVLDIAATKDWVTEALKACASHPVEFIVPVAHGAAVAGVRDEEPAFQSPDYEAQLPAEMLAQYCQQRDDFALTGSPALPAGLNLGAQLHQLDQSGALADAMLMPYAQYWAWVLSGNAVSEVTSLGCHTDLWVPAQGDFSPMAKRRGWAERFAPLAKAGDVIGTLRPQLAAQTGLSEKVQVLAGLHDSNAALLAARGFAEIADNDASVLSTGTWFIAMRSTSAAAANCELDERRDCLMNIDVAGKAVPTARFMGGREIETLIEIDTRSVDIKPDQPALLDAVAKVIANGAMVLPTLAPGTGPFPHGKGGWVNRPENWHERRAAACLYAALLADASLDLIGSRARLLVEGRFAEAEVFVRALASLRPQMQVYVANAHNDVSFGALRLIDPALTPQGELRRVVPLAEDISPYRAAWLGLSGGC